jgi:hypothetical protein
MIARSPRHATTITVLATIAAVAAGCGGGGTEGGCGDTASCGGDPTGTWKVDGVCQYQPPVPDQPISLPEYTSGKVDPMLTPPQPQPTTSGSWCSGLIFVPPNPQAPGGSIKTVNLWHDPVNFTSGTKTLSQDHKYQSNLVFSTQSTTYFPTSCLQANGFNPTCAQLQSALTTYYVGAAMQAKVQSAYTAPAGVDPAAGIQCVPTTDEGCNCHYTYQLEVADSGAWATSDGLLSETSASYTYNGVLNQTDQPTVPVVANYCASGNHLTLSGNAGTSLSGVVGLRTLSLRKM